MVANTNCSPNETFYYPDAYDRANLANPQTFQTSQTSQLALHPFFDSPVSSIGLPPSGFRAKSPPVYNSTSTGATALAATIPNTEPWASARPESFDLAEQLPWFLPDPGTTEFDHSGLFPQDASRTHSVCGDESDQLYSSPPSSLKHKSLSSLVVNIDEESSPKRAQRKQGRPQLNGASTSKHRPRLSHNRIERRYRENLNSEIERLRQAVPTLAQSQKGATMAQAKPTKAMVLAGAIHYIKKIEQERDMLTAEVERTRNEAYRLGSPYSLWPQCCDGAVGLIDSST